MSSQLVFIGARAELITTSKNVPTNATAISTKIQPGRALPLLSLISSSLA
jgi:hypothetical protein